MSFPQAMRCLLLVLALTTVLRTLPADAASNVMMRRADIDEAGGVIASESGENRPLCVIDAVPHCEDVYWFPNQSSFDFCQFECLAIHKFRFFFWIDNTIQNNCACTPADCHTVKGHENTISGALNCRGLRNMTTTTTTSTLGTDAENSSSTTTSTLGTPCDTGMEPRCEGADWRPAQVSVQDCQNACRAQGKFRFFFSPIGHTCACTISNCSTANTTNSTVSGDVECDFTSAPCQVGLVPRCEGIDWRSSQTSHEACQKECSDRGDLNFFFWPKDSSCACTDATCGTWESKSTVISGSWDCTVMDENSTADQSTTTLATTSTQLPDMS